MFTGIIETMGVVKDVAGHGSGKTIWIESAISAQLGVDQSVCHDGVCLTIEEVAGNAHRVTAVEETLSKSNIGNWRQGTLVNLERSLRVDSRLDGHFVQGHVDTTAECISKRERNGSWEYGFSFPKDFRELIVEKGSVAVNGISLTAYNVRKKSFQVAIIPFTYEHTNIKAIQEGDIVNLEFDMLGKFVARTLSRQR